MKTSCPHFGLLRNSWRGQDLAKDNFQLRIATIATSQPTARWCLWFFPDPPIVKRLWKKYLKRSPKLKKPWCLWLLRGDCNSLRGVLYLCFTHAISFLISAPRPLADESLVDKRPPLHNMRLFQIFQVFQDPMRGGRVLGLRWTHMISVEKSQTHLGPKPMTFGNINMKNSLLMSNDDIVVI